MRPLTGAVSRIILEIMEESDIDPRVEIEELAAKNQEKERKGAGAFWKIRVRGQGLFASPQSRVALWACLLFGASLASGLGASLMLRRDGGFGKGLSLGATLDGLRIKRPKDRSLKALSQANAGKLSFDEAREKPGEGGVGSEGAAEPTQDIEEALKGAARGSEAGNGEKRSGIEGGDPGGTSMYYDSPAVGKKMPAGTVEGGHVPGGGSLSASRAVNSVRAQGGRSARAVHSKNAFGQLAFAKQASQIGARVGGEAGSQYAANAFEQAAVGGGRLSPLPPGSAPPDALGSETVHPQGTGAPNLFPPTMQPGVDVTPEWMKIEKEKADGLMANAKSLRDATQNNILLAALVAGAAGAALGFMMGGPMGALVGAALSAGGTVALMYFLNKNHFEQADAYERQATQMERDARARAEKEWARYRNPAVRQAVEQQRKKLDSLPRLP